MWVLVVIALNAQLIFTVPGYSTEQTCSAGAAETIAALTRVKHHISWTHYCIKAN